MHDEPRFPDATLIDDCLLADRHAFRKRLAGLQRRWKNKQPVDIGLEKLEKEILASRQTVALRRDLAREISFPPDLPITGRLDEIRETIAASQIVILCGETGSGKSTQLPKICLSLGLGIHGRIGHTQPRRIAARSLMSRISAELGSEPGALVGYKVRFKDHVRRQTRVKLMTDGILLAEIQRDAWLNEYDTLIIDEAHERSLNIDFLLGYVKQLIARRSDLKVIITSATIDTERYEVRRGGELVPLTPVEFKLLVTLVAADGRALTRDQLLDAVYGSDDGDVLDRTIDVHVGRLREKLGDDAERPRYVMTVRGVGYRAAPPLEEAPAEAPAEG